MTLFLPSDAGFPTTASGNDDWYLTLGPTTLQIAFRVNLTLPLASRAMVMS